MPRLTAMLIALVLLGSAGCSAGPHDKASSGCDAGQATSCHQPTDHSSSGSGNMGNGGMGHGMM
jgi:hypothetical protein